MCNYRGTGQVKDRRTHEYGHFYSFICIDCLTVRRSWPSLMAAHKADRRSHSFAIVGVDGWERFMEWVRGNHLSVSRAFRLGAGNLPEIARPERRAFKDAEDDLPRPRRARRLSSSSSDSQEWLACIPVFHLTSDCIHFMPYVTLFITIFYILFTYYLSSSIHAYLK